MLKARKKIEFVKMQGIGNDYIYIDCFKQSISSPKRLAVVMSDRHFGVGGDGIVLILPSNCADARMRMFNADGSEGGMCGNAIRCVAKYLFDSGIVQKKRMLIETKSGIKELKVFVKYKKVMKVVVDMGRAELMPSKIPVATLGSDFVINRSVPIGGREYHITCVSMGNPHCVVFVNKNPSIINLEKLGPKFENNPIFPDRVNTEFVEVIGSNLLKMRVYERGSGETLACGTGACAAAVAAVLNGYCKKDDDIKIRLLGGELTVNYNDERVLLIGGAEKVFEGMMEL